MCRGGKYTIRALQNELDELGGEGGGFVSGRKRNLEDEDKLRILHHCCGRLESIDKEEDTSMVDFLTSCYG